MTRSPEGTLQLVGKECGQSILTISSMPISKKLTVAEREILIEDYITPLFSKNLKDLTSLIVLMKDTTIEDNKEALKEELKTKEEIAVNTHTSFDYNKQHTAIKFIYSYR